MSLVKWWISGLVALTGCRALLGIDDPQPHADAASDASTDAAIDAPPDAFGTTYHANAVHFDGNSYYARNGLENTARSPRGTFSVWIKLDGGDGTLQLIAAAQVAGIGGIGRQTDNTFELLMEACDAAPLLDIHSAKAYTATSGWLHVLAAWDVSANKAQLYINDVADLSATQTIKSGDICYDLPVWGLGGVSSGTLDADVADLYSVLGTFIDLDVPANRALFSKTGKPVSLGDHCTTPTGHVPTGCFVGAANVWGINEGNGGPFTAHGDPITDALTSPSD